MSVARRSEGPRAPLFFFLAAATVNGAVWASPVEQADLKRCSEMSTDERKLACFEALIENPPEQTADVAGAAGAAEISNAPMAETGAIAVNVPDEAPVDAVADAAEPADDFGGKYVKESKANVESDEDEDADVAATVSAVTRDSFKRLQFEFANGQVWRQLEARHFPYPKDRAFEVVISRGVFGDYQLRVGGEGRMTRIRRIK